MTHMGDDWRERLARYGPALLLYARQFCATHAAAEDAVQEAFVRYYERQAGALDPLAYLFRCVRSASLDESRAARRRRKRETRAREPEPWFVPAAEIAERPAVIERALEALPEEQRAVVVLKIWGELTFAQIAGALEISQNTAASRYRYALARLAGLLEEVRHE